MSLLEVSALRKIYGARGGSRVEALRDISFRVERGEYVAIMGSPAPGRPRSSTSWRPWTGPPAAELSWTERTCPG